MQLVACDPKVTSIMTKARGEKGYRVLQGERLRNLLNEIIQEEVNKPWGFTQLNTWQAWIQGGGPRGHLPPPPTSKKIGLTNTKNRPKITVPPPPPVCAPLDYPFWIRTCMVPMHEHKNV